MNRTSLSLTFALLSTLTLPACGGEDDGGDSTSGADPEAAEFAEAVPTSDELALSMDDGDEAALTDEAALEGGPSQLRAFARQIFENVNALREQAHARVEELFEGALPVTVTKGSVECRRWEADGDAGRAHWRLTSCRRDAKNRHFAFELEGRPIDAGDEAYVIVMAGEGKVMARFDGKRRGAGRVGFNFDHLAELTGQEGPAGKLGIGYRAVGRVRQLNVGLRDFARAGDDTPVTGLYRYKHIVEVGGRVSLLAHGDLVARDAEDRLTLGSDGLDELVRAAVAWNRGVGARAAAAVCGGTVGEGECVRVLQCWQRSGEVSMEAVGDGGRFERTECPRAAAGLDDVEDAPEADDFEVPAGDELPPEPGADGAEAE